MKGAAIALCQFVFALVMIGWVAVIHGPLIPVRAAPVAEAVFGYIGDHALLEAAVIVAFVFGAAATVQQMLAGFRETREANAKLQQKHN